ncbi:hypothetical protein [Saccharopolyspora sp. 5N708]|uniref:hypothetical protein n=1 Tax=Saccharopolyspora sp. 5N708 TaxID=3457424 RepID=UPI003FCEE960
MGSIDVAALLRTAVRSCRNDLGESRLRTEPIWSPKKFVRAALAQSLSIIGAAIPSFGCAVG